MTKAAAAQHTTNRATGPNASLRRARERKCWSQAELAERVGTTAFTVCRWERGVTFPGPHFRQRLCALFECGPDQVGLLPETRQAGSRAALSTSATHVTRHGPASPPDTPVAENAGALSSIGARARDDACSERELPRIEPDLAGASHFSPAQVRDMLAISPLLLARGLYARAETYLLRAQRAVTRDDDGTAAPRIQLYLARIAELRGNLAAADQWYDDALRSARAAGDDALITRVLAHRSEVAINRGLYQDAEPWLSEGLELARARGDRAAQANLLRLLGEARDCAGDFARGDELYLQGLELARKGDDLETQASLLQNLGEKAMKRGRHDAAEDYLRQGIESARAMGHQQRMSALLTALAILKNQQRSYAEAETLCCESVRLARAIGHPIRLINALLALAESLCHRHDGTQDDDGRAEHIHEALYLARSIPHPFLIAGCLVRLGELQLTQGKVDAAGETFEEACTVSCRAGAHEMEASALFGLARVASFRHDTGAACGYAARSLRYFAAEGHEKANEVEEWLSSLT